MKKYCWRTEEKARTLLAHAGETIRRQNDVYAYNARDYARHALELVEKSRSEHARGSRRAAGWCHYAARAVTVATLELRRRSR